MMSIPSDIEIAQSCQLQPIDKIAETAGVDADYLESYGRYKAKVDHRLLRESTRPYGKLILVTAINPTPAGEGKTTTTVGLGDALRRMGKNAVICGALPGSCVRCQGRCRGGGYAQGGPHEDINLHFTGDLHAVTAANLLLPWWTTTSSRATPWAWTPSR